MPKKETEKNKKQDKFVVKNSKRKLFTLNLDVAINFSTINTKKTTEFCWGTPLLLNARRILPVYPISKDK